MDGASPTGEIFHWRRLPGGAPALAVLCANRRFATKQRVGGHSSRQLPELSRAVFIHQPSRRFSAGRQGQPPLGR